MFQKDGDWNALVMTTTADKQKKVTNPPRQNDVRNANRHSRLGIETNQYHIFEVNLLNVFVCLFDLHFIAFKRRFNALKGT